MRYSCYGGCEMRRKILFLEGGMCIMGANDEEKKFIEKNAAFFGCLCDVLFEHGSSYSLYVRGSRLYQCEN